MIAFVFIMWHVFHMHGWLHQPEALVENIEKAGGHQFRAYNAASSAGAALSANLLVPVAYAVGIIACVFHLANGIWTMGITWGLWISPAAQRRANWVSVGFGVVLGIIGLSALVGMRNVDQDEALKVENQMYNAKVASGELTPNEHKRSHDKSHAEAAEDGETHEAAALESKETEAALTNEPG
jgi:succinate dehydrogenase / fumarate reductase cytochrome b subunit